MANRNKVYHDYASRNLGELAILISDHITAMLAYWDKDLVCRYANRAYVDWFGKTKDQMINRIRIDELLGPLYEKNLPYIKGVLEGRKQVFEREIPIPDGSGVRQSLATYIPDIKDGKVLGFFVHVSDVSYLKNLEKEIATAKRETLRKIIEAEEAEKRNLVEILRENINQRLVAGRMVIESARKQNAENRLLEEISLSMSEVIRELNLLCQDLIPTEIEVLGLIETCEIYLAKIAKQSHKTIDLEFDKGAIEALSATDKYSIFRILQNFVTMAFGAGTTGNIEVCLSYDEPQVKIKFVTDARFLLDTASKEYHAIVCRVDYYSGKMTECLSGSRRVFEIELSLHGM